MYFEVGLSVDLIPISGSANCVINQCTFKWIPTHACTISLVSSIICPSFQDCTYEYIFISSSLSLGRLYPTSIIPGIPFFSRLIQTPPSNYGRKYRAIRNLLWPHRETQPQPSALSLSASTMWVTAWIIAEQGNKLLSFYAVKYALHCSQGLSVAPVILSLPAGHTIESHFSKIHIKNFVLFSPLSSNLYLRFW